MSLVRCNRGEVVLSLSVDVVPFVWMSLGFLRWREDSGLIAMGVAMEVLVNVDVDVAMAAVVN